MERTPPLTQWDSDLIEPEALKEGDEAVRRLEQAKGDFFCLLIPASPRNKQLLGGSVFRDNTDKPFAIPDCIFSESWGFTYNLSLIPLSQEDLELRLCNHIRRFFAKICTHDPRYPHRLLDREPSSGTSGLHDYSKGRNIVMLRFLHSSVLTPSYTSIPSFPSDLKG